MYKNSTIITFLPTFLHTIKAKKIMATVETATDATPTRLAPDSEFLGATGPAPSLVKKING